MPPVLFSANSAFSDQLRRSVVERWVAAWYYMVSRYPEELKTDAALRGELKGLGESVLLWTKDTRDPHLMKLRDEIAQFRCKTPVPPYAILHRGTTAGREDSLYGMIATHL